MKAKRSYRLLHTRSSRRPAALDPTRIDHLEVVEVASGEVVLFWDLPASDAAKRARRLREDLNLLEVDEFVDRWCALDLTSVDAIHGSDEPGAGS
jgi:hypothetical protein